jgi:hypothetical protein
VKPDNPEVVAAVEQLAEMFFENGDNQHWFHFVLLQSDRITCSHAFDPIGTVKSWITRSRRTFTDHWRDAEAVVLSYRRKKYIRFNVVLNGTDQAYKLDVFFKSGKMAWKALSTKEAEQLKEALRVAQR